MWEVGNVIKHLMLFYSRLVLVGFFFEFFGFLFIYFMKPTEFELIKNQYVGCR